MAKVAEFAGVPSTTDGERQYTKINWAQVAKLNSDSGGKPVQLDRGTDFTAKHASAVVQQARSWAKKTGYTVTFEIADADTVRVLLTKKSVQGPATTEAVPSFTEAVPVA